MPNRDIYKIISNERYMLGCVAVILLMIYSCYILYGYSENAGNESSKTLYVRGTHRIAETITLAKNSIIIITAGSEIIFEETGKIVCEENTSIIACGTEEEPVVIRNIKPGTINGRDATICMTNVKIYIINTHINGGYDVINISDFRIYGRNIDVTGQNGVVMIDMYNCEAIIHGFVFDNTKHVIMENHNSDIQINGTQFVVIDNEIEITLTGLSKIENVVIKSCKSIGVYMQAEREVGGIKIDITEYECANITIKAPLVQNIDVYNKENGCNDAVVDIGNGNKKCEIINSNIYGYEYQGSNKNIIMKNNTIFVNALTNRYNDYFGLHYEFGERMKSVLRKNIVYIKIAPDAYKYAIYDLREWGVEINKRGDYYVLGLMNGSGRNEGKDNGGNMQ